MLKFISTTRKYLDWKYIACLYIWKIDICISKNLFPIFLFYYFTILGTPLATIKSKLMTPNYEKNTTNYEKNTTNYEKNTTNYEKNTTNYEKNTTNFFKIFLIKSDFF